MPPPDPARTKSIASHVGCAGWSIPRQHAEYFPETGSHLERYAARFPAVEINSSFYRPHRPATYARWAASVPDGFMFAVKMPRQITHAGRLAGPTAELDRFLDETSALGPARGPLLVQLPPGLLFAGEVAAVFFAALRERFSGHVVCEPRHPGWFTPEAERLLVEWQVARVAADPAIVPRAGEPAGWSGLVYYRLHGSPRIYYSGYSAGYLDRLARSVAEVARSAPVWCIFDNTALGAATVDALGLLDRLQN